MVPLVVLFMVYDWSAARHGDISIFLMFEYEHCQKFLVVAIYATR